MGSSVTRLIRKLSFKTFMVRFLTVLTFFVTIIIVTSHFVIFNSNLPALEPATNVSNPSQLVDRAYRHFLQEMQSQRMYESIRTLVNGLEGMRRPNNTCQQLPLDELVKHNTTHFPNVIHLMRFYRDHWEAEFDFIQFTSVVSAERFLRPSVIVLWSNIEPHGFYYDLLRANIYCLKWQSLQQCKTIGNQTVKSIQHSADYQKLQKLRKYGGTIVDLDIIFINGTKFTESLNGYECVLGCEKACSQINIGIVSCQPNSQFIKLWLNGYDHDFQPQMWTYNSKNYPGNLLAKNIYSNRTAIKLDDRITQNPMWNEKTAWLQPGGVDQWRTKPVTHHFWKMYQLREQTKVESDYGLMLMRNSFGELLRHVFNLALT